MSGGLQAGLLLFTVLLHSRTSMLRYNEGPKDRQNMFAYTTFRYIEVLLIHIFYYYWGKNNRSLY